MTREEAIAELREDKALYESDICHAGDGSPDGRLLQALDMAIEALQAEAVHGETVQVKPTRKKIYIAGPVTGVEDYAETFDKAADALRAKGYEPVNPVAPGLVEGYSYRDYINQGFQMLMDCDGMLLLPGYMDSKGAALELHYALAVGMEIMTGGAIK